MKAFFGTLIMSMLLVCGSLAAQDKSNDVFAPISKYLSQGDSESLSAWFADNLEISILNKSSNCSKSQARQIIKAFFDSYTPRSFAITHTAGKGFMKYALGRLNAGGESFMVTIFVNCEKETFSIQQIKIDRIE